MADYIESLQGLAEKFGRLPGVGRKSAMRMAFAVLDFSKEDVAEFAESVMRTIEYFGLHVDIQLTNPEDMTFSMLLYQGYHPILEITA